MYRLVILLNITRASEGSYSMFVLSFAMQKSLLSINAYSSGHFMPPSILYIGNAYRLAWTAKQDGRA